VRARLVQRLLDSVAEWNGLGKVIEVYACTPRSAKSMEADEELELWSDFGSGHLSTRAMAEFAHNVGLDEDQLQQILRKLGSGFTSLLSQEPMGEHDVIVALDRAGLDAAKAELVRQGIDPRDVHTMLLSDFVWYYEANHSLISDAICSDGSGTGFLDDRMEKALSRFDFESKSQASLPTSSSESSPLASTASDAMDTPAWPHGRNESARRPGEWRKLHGTLLKGCAGLSHFLVSDWIRNYCNPLKDLKYETAVDPSK